MSKRIKTFNDIKGREHDSGEESGNEGQSFFVGGSEHSGQQVMGPSRNDIRQQLFDAARRAGAEVLPSGEASPDNARARSFPGGGAKLGGAGSTETSEPIPDVPEMPEDNVVIVRVSMYHDGFTIEDGPYRAFAENEEFVNEIMTGRIPTEIQLAHPRKKIDLRISPVSGDYVPPKPKAFQGTGARLGAIVPDVIVGTAPTLPVQSEEEKAKSLADAQSNVKLEDDAPVTQVQIRFENGQRLVAKFNHNHTVQEIRSFVVTAVPDYAFTPFNLMQSFPRTLIEDETVTLAAAGLINSVVIVKAI
ncbi:unnamed protein product [Auanema sp. JU1783]|nr:unnamed protein product [Auanema sp. JU1783]